MSPICALRAKSSLYCFNKQVYDYHKDEQEKNKEHATEITMFVLDTCLNPYKAKFQFIDFPGGKFWKFAFPTQSLFCCFLLVYLVWGTAGCFTALLVSNGRFLVVRANLDFCLVPVPPERTRDRVDGFCTSDPGSTHVDKVSHLITEDWRVASSKSFAKELHLSRQYLGKNIQG